MKYLLPLILLGLLLSGCGRQTLPEESTAPTESVAGDITEPEEYGGAVRTIPLNLKTVQGFCIFEENLLLLSGNESSELTLLGPDCQTVLAARTLDIPLEQEDLAFHSGGLLSFYDPAAEATVVLDGSLAEADRIPAPDALSGRPILSRDAGTLYYCTASHVRAWDLASGIRRCVTEMALPGKSLKDLLLEGSVLQCQTDSGQTLFLSAEDGRILHRSEGIYAVQTLEDRYYGLIPAGDYRAAVFGQESPRLLFPEDPQAPLFFLPRQHRALTAAPDDGILQLELYDLSTGCRTHRLTLPGSQEPRAAACLDRDTIVVLTHDPVQDREVLTLWDPGSSTAPEDAGAYLHPYTTADPKALDRCRQKARQIGDRFGIRILIGQEAADAAPGDHSFTPELLAPVLERELDLLEARLSRFPDPILPRTAAHFSGVTVCLVRSLEGLGRNQPQASNGVQYLLDGEACIAVPTGRRGAQALYHGLFHLMEVHIFAESKAFDGWDSLNPAGFSYDLDYGKNARRDSGVYLFEGNRAFVDTFSMSYPREDRARILEYAMLPGQEELFRHAAMQKKLTALCDGIREAYGLQKQPDTFLWEQYLE